VARDAAGRGGSRRLCDAVILAARLDGEQQVDHGGYAIWSSGSGGWYASRWRKREVLMRLAPQSGEPLRFVLLMLPDCGPKWMIRAGLWSHDRLGGAGSLPRAGRSICVARPFDDDLDPRSAADFSYSDCKVTTLVWSWSMRLRHTLGRKSCRAPPCVRLTTTPKWLARRPRGCRWTARFISAKAVVNAAGPLVEQLFARIADCMCGPGYAVKGAHRRAAQNRGDHAYILQNQDRRIVFLLPFERDSP